VARHQTLFIRVVGSIFLYFKVRIGLIGLVWGFTYRDEQQGASKLFNSKGPTDNFRSA
jgi:hypothetical protein